MTMSHLVKLCPSLKGRTSFLRMPLPELSFARSTAPCPVFDADSTRPGLRGAPLSGVRSDEGTPHFFSYDRHGTA